MPAPKVYSKEDILRAMRFTKSKTSLKTEQDGNPSPQKKSK